MDRGFPDFDLDAGDLGGNLSWEEPLELELLEFYNVYMAIAVEDSDSTADEHQSFTSRSFLGAVPKGTKEFLIPPETALGNFTHFLVYLHSALAEQTTPSSSSEAPEETLNW
ncbi:unnamed protein product [Effrenium voratum]|uniref:Uncharacterized protein n=1 Tax=Effrenium voratum TaxID=2562239 RepID=A0AA36ILT9_9DINO|nr:unnamed protein product [Effrenium voratum]